MKMDDIRKLSDEVDEETLTTLVSALCNASSLPVPEDPNQKKDKDEASIQDVNPTKKKSKSAQKAQDKALKLALKDCEEMVCVYKTKFFYPIVLLMLSWSL